ncbi:MAG: sigma-70 family RNA polymerase sigma factor [Oscillospiraceae bacterium]|nr:sigma-70 family RNA polymerase sigma factor [Oscillospiraceae bacterium]
MTELEFVFEQNPLELFLDSVLPGQCVSGAQLLTVSEAESEAALEEALDQLQTRQVTLDLQNLQIPTPGGQTATRLQLEEKLARGGFSVTGLEENDTLRLYLEELAAIPVCGDVRLVAEEVSDANRRGEAPTQAHTKLVELSLSRVVELSGEFTGKGVMLLDLIQEGSVGLWHAVEAFCTEPEEFEAFRDAQVRFCMARQVLLQAKATGVGQMLRRAMEDYRSVDERLLTELGRNPEPEELAEALHLSLQQTLLLSQLVENTRQMRRAAQPEPEQLPQEEDQAVEDTAYFQMRQRISELLSQLTPEDAQLISLRYGLEGGLPMKPQQVAARLGISPEEVVAREASALSKLRETKD